MNMQSDKMEPDRDMTREYRVLCEEYMEKAERCLKREEYDGAKEYYEKGLELAGKIAEKNRTVEVRCMLSDIHYGLGNICIATEQTETAAEHYLKSVSFREQAAEEMPATSNDGLFNRCSLLVRYYMLSEIYSRLSDYPKAKECRESGLAYCEELIAECEADEGKELLASGYHELGFVCLRMNRLSEAQEHLIKAIEVRRGITDPKKPKDCKSKLARSYVLLGDIYTGEKKPDAAVESYMEACDIWEELIKEYPDDPQYPKCRDLIKEACVKLIFSV